MFGKSFAFWNSYLNEWPNITALYIIQEKIGVHTLVNYDIGRWISVKCEKLIYFVKWIIVSLTKGIHIVALGGGGAVLTEKNINCVWNDNKVD